MVRAIEINPTTFPPSKIANVGVLLSTLLPLFFIGCSLLFLVYMIWGAIDWIRSGNNKDNVIKAQQKWRYAILGYVVVLASLLIVKILGFISSITFPL